MFRLKFAETDYELIETDGETYAEGDIDGAYVHSETYNSVGAFVSAIADYTTGEKSCSPGPLGAGDWLTVRDEDICTGGWTERVCALERDATPFEIMLFNAAIRMHA